MNDFKPNPRTRVRRQHQRGHYDRETIYQVLDSHVLCHVGYNIDGLPYVTPTLYWREGDTLYWHGSSASRMLRTQAGGVPACVTVSQLDGLVMARSGFHHSINYRAVMAFGTARLVERADAKTAVLKAFMERLYPGRWDEIRPMTTQELKATKVMKMPIDEASAKIRTGPPVDDEEDYDLVDCWAGVVPIRMVVGKPEDDPRLKPGLTVPESLKRFSIG
jgi:nitroimidazol reductase NimA-like FMN-containing flavoprotein (pyridoxamine 5'-phosphate oxidase superfamily)